MASDNALLGKVDPVMQQLMRNPVGTSVYPGPQTVRNADLEPFNPLVRVAGKKGITQGDIESAAEILNWVGSIGGMNAARPPAQALQFAQKLERAGAKPETIWKGYGLMRDKAGNWMFEIPDDKMRLNIKEGPRPEYTDKGNPGFYMERPESWPKPPTSTAPQGWQSIQPDAQLYPHFPTGTRVGDVVEHSELFRQYPHVQNLLIDVPLDFTGSLRGAYYPQSKRVGIAGGKATDVPGTVAHELGHAVQHFEEMPNGGNPGQFKPKDYQTIVDDQKAWEEVFNNYVKHNNVPAEHQDILRYSVNAKNIPKRYQEILDDYGRHFPDVYEAARTADLLKKRVREMDAAAYDQYRSLHGEQNAEAIARRLELTPRQRWEQPFWEHYTTPMDNQLLGDIQPWLP